MSLLITLAGVNYTIPEPSDAFTQGVTDYLKAITIAPYWQSPTANPAASGFVRLATGDAVAWRNAANNADVLLNKDASDNLQWAGNKVTGNPFLEATTVAGQSFTSGTTSIVVFGTVVTDTDSGWNSGTGRYTVPTGKGGRYFVSSTIQWSAAGVGAGVNQFSLYAYKNAALLVNLDNESLTPGTTFAANNSLSGSTIINCAVGDVLDVRATQNSGGAITLATFATANRIVIHRLVS